MASSLPSKAPLSLEEAGRKDLQPLSDEIVETNQSVSSVGLLADKCYRVACGGFFHECLDYIPRSLRSVGVDHLSLLLVHHHLSRCVNMEGAWTNYSTTTTTVAQYLGIFTLHYDFCLSGDSMYVHNKFYSSSIQILPYISNIFRKMYSL